MSKDTKLYIEVVCINTPRPPKHPAVQRFSLELWEENRYYSSLLSAHLEQYAYYGILDTCEPLGLQQALDTARYLKKA